MLDVAIIGGGLSGLALAQRLLAAGRDVEVFEARSRFGGRILSRPETDGFRHDLGPSWIWPDFQPRLARFIAEHDIAVYPQWQSGKSLYQTSHDLPAEAYVDEGTYAPARRLHGGMYHLVEALLQSLPAQRLKSRYQLEAVTDAGEHVELLFGRVPEPGAEQGQQEDRAPFSVSARQVVMTIPPRLLAATVRFTPALDERLREVMTGTPTWMAGHAKAVVRYARPFWRDAGLAGIALAGYPGAALGQIFDASAPDGTQAALSGFFALPAVLRTQHCAELEPLLLAQLVRLFGKDAAQALDIQIMDWAAEPLTAAAQDANPQRQHPQYGHPWLQLDHWRDKLYFSGTETAPEFGGYLEGALEAAERVANSISL